MHNKIVALAISRACTGGSQDVDSVAARIAKLLGRQQSKTLVAMAARYTRAFTNGAPRESDALQFVLRDSTWRFYIRARPDKRRVHPPTVQAWPLDAPHMRPTAPAGDWPIRRVESSGELAEWLGLSVGELEWLADVKGIVGKAPRSPLHHYHYRLVRKPTGGIRLIEAPQARLKTIQRKILAEILEKVPSHFTAAHGFVKGRSVHTFAQPHVGHAVVVRLDLQNFFPTIGYARVQAFFRTMGYPDVVASALSGLCTSAAPPHLFNVHGVYASEFELFKAARSLYSRPHLPQGAPTSPLLANLCAFRLDCRLTGLADWAGAVYTRYADDIALSGDDTFARNATRYIAEVSAIARDEGWSVQHHKTRIMHASVRQQLAGIVVNRTPNIDRTSFDQLKATLTNCVRLGPASQNRDQRNNFQAYLRGCVAWVTSVNAKRGNRLSEIFERIDWSR